MMNWKGCGKKRSWPNFKVLSRHLRSGTDKNTKRLSQDSQSPGWSLNPGLTEHEAGAFYSLPRLSVRPVDGSIKHVLSVGQYLRDYTAQHRRRQRISIRNTAWLILFWETVAVYSEKHDTHKNLKGEVQGYWLLKQVVHRVTTVL
jgi:hypothetical protein